MNLITCELDQWNALQPGDVVLWNGTKLRTVIHGPNRSGGGIVFSKLSRGKYGPLTCYGWNDIKHRIIPTGKRIKTVISLPEKLRIAYLGWNPRRAFVKVVRDEIALKKRMGRELCGRKLVLP